MIKFDFKIENDVWNVALLSQEEYNSAVDYESEAYVDVNQRKIVFNYNRITRAIIEHEMTHIYFDLCCLRSVDEFKVEQMEEIVAEFVPKHARKIFKVSRDLRKKIDEKMLEDEE